MIEYKENIELCKMAQQFVAGEMTAVDFVDKYMDIHDHNPYGDAKADVVDSDYVKDSSLLSSVYLHCDTHESMHGDGGYTDSELRDAVAIFLAADNVESGYRQLEGKGLLK